MTRFDGMMQVYDKEKSGTNDMYLSIGTIFLVTDESEDFGSVKFFCTVNNEFGVKKHFHEVMNDLIGLQEKNDFVVIKTDMAHYSTAAIRMSSIKSLIPKLAGGCSILTTDGVYACKEPADGVVKKLALARKGNIILNLPEKML